MSRNSGFKNRISALSRTNKLQHFYSIFKNGESVLDVGVSAETNRGLQSRNYFLKNYKYSPETYVGLGVQDLTGMESLFPKKRFVQYLGGEFPFADKEFDWVFSNAVIEHVGNDEDQLLFLNEMMRVAKNVFFTTPNKYFPIESHTNVFFLHWHNQLFNYWRKKNNSKGCIYLFSIQRLKKLLESSNAESFLVYKNRFMGIPMTLTITCTDSKESHILDHAKSLSTLRTSS